MQIEITSSAFAAGERIPRKYTGEGEDISPPLRWSGVPASAKELALICDDPDAPRPTPWVHWVVYGIPADRTGLEEGSAGGAKEGMNDFGNTGYGGPMPPPGHGVHHYHFKLYALDTALEASAGLTKDELEAAMNGHILAQGERLGTYER
jgi:Raf kinase inhibitor-like YbhB/YbcL family protein